jgi:hypothetical protein
MNPFLMAFAVALVSSTFALADTPVTPAEAEKIKAALAQLSQLACQNDNFREF